MTRPIEIGRELIRAFLGLDDAQRRWFDAHKKEGVLYGVGRIAVCADGIFEFSEDGMDAMIYGVSDGSWVYDLAAWTRDAPEKVYTRLGVAQWLGDVHIFAAKRLGEVLKMYPHPLAWLQGGCDGACYLGDLAGRGFYLGEELEDVAEIDCGGDEDFATAVYSALRKRRPRPPIPAILPLALPAATPDAASLAQNVHGDRKLADSCRLSAVSPEDAHV